MTAPRVAVKSVDNLSAKWISLDVPEQRNKIGFFLTQNCLVTALEQMADSTVLMIVIESISLVEALQYLGQGSRLGLDQEVNMVPMRT